ncbi:hypothetical protein [Burkholderia sp. AW49-1]
MNLSFLFVLFYISKQLLQIFVTIGVIINWIGGRWEGGQEIRRMIQTGGSGVIKMVNIIYNLAPFFWGAILSSILSFWRIGWL